MKGKMTLEEQKLIQAVNDFGMKMRIRLLEKLKDGYTGWDRPKIEKRTTEADLTLRAITCIMSGKYVDVANLAMFLYCQNKKG